MYEIRILVVRVVRDLFFCMILDGGLVNKVVIFLDLVFWEEESFFCVFKVNSCIYFFNVFWKF